MIRFRNPGTQYSTQVQVFKELFNEYKNAEYFTLDDMAMTIAKCSLMTAYGYAGEQALSLSNTDNDSLNSTKMNAKMYAEVFRLLGWITSYGKSSYPLVFTYIGEHAANADDVLPLYEQCVLGINNPQEIMDVKYTENVRFFKAALSAMSDLDGIMYKHEFCLGPMSIDDLDEQQYSQMLKKIKSLRGSYSRYEKAYGELCADLNVKPTLPDNSTRLPIAFMKTCKWIVSERTNKLYPPKSLECLRITPKGETLSKSLNQMKDLRLDEYHKYDSKTKEALIRLGVFSMLKRAGYDIEPILEQYNKDLAICQSVLEGKELLFSPYQTLHHAEVDKALGLVRTQTKVNASSRHIESKMTREDVKVNKLLINKDIHDVKTDNEITQFANIVIRKHKEGKSINKICDEITDSVISYTQTKFYPFVAMLFRVIGFNCSISRPGDNGARWDAIIIDKSESIPIEIKSPTEEIHISLKAVRQAMENKIVLLSRQTHPTKPETVSLAVGYKLPNERAEVVNLINDFKNAYGYSIGVFDIHTLLKISVTTIIKKRTTSKKEIERMEGLASANFE